MERRKWTDPHTQSKGGGRGGIQESGGLWPDRRLWAPRRNSAENNAGRSFRRRRPCPPPSLSYSGNQPRTRILLGPGC